MRIAIILEETLGSGLLANAAACIASGLFNGRQDILGPAIEGEGVAYIPITNIACLVLRRSGKPWAELLARAQRQGLTYMLFTRQAQSTTNYEEYAARVKGRRLEDVDVIGLGILGEDQKVTKCCGDLALLR